jgi:hypothetical protein
MDTTAYVEITVGAIGILGSLFSWALNIKIKHDILANNAKIEKEIEILKDGLTRSIGGVNDNLIRELGTFKDRITDKTEELDRELTELKSNLTDRILSTVNGKYVRTDLHQQTIIGIQDRLLSFKQIIEVNIQKIEESLDRQISDLKERIFQDK